MCRAPNPGQLRPERRPDVEILDIDREAAKRPGCHASSILPCPPVDALGDRFGHTAQKECELDARRM